jgi:hypothetical protein
MFFAEAEPALKNCLRRAVRVQFLEVSTLQGPELSLDYFEILLSMR